MSEIRDEFIKAAFALSKAAPREWEEFVASVVAYTAVELEVALRTPIHEAQHALGMSRRLVDIRDDLCNIVKLAERVKR